MHRWSHVQAAFSREAPSLASGASPDGREASPSVLRNGVQTPYCHASSRETGVPSMCPPPEPDAMPLPPLRVSGRLSPRQSHRVSSRKSFKNLRDASPSVIFRDGQDGVPALAGAEPLQAQGPRPPAEDDVGHEGITPALPGLAAPSVSEVLRVGSLLHEADDAVVGRLVALSPRAATPRASAAEGERPQTRWPSRVERFTFS